MGKIEYEVRILEIDHEDVIKRLEALGAEFIFDSMQKRYVYDVKPVQPNKWIRLRQNQDGTTLTIKDLSAKTIDGTKEIEIKVDDFDTTNELLEELGYFNRGFQENRRVQYRLDGVEIDLDKWPLIPEYLEIEGHNEEEVYRTVERLGFSKDDIVTLDVSSIYTHYGYDGESLADLSFSMEKNN